MSDNNINIISNDSNKPKPIRFNMLTSERIILFNKILTIKRNNTTNLNSGCKKEISVFSFV